MNTMFQVSITAFLFPFTCQSIILEAADIFHKYHKLHSTLVVVVSCRADVMLCVFVLKKKRDLEQWIIVCVRVCVTTTCIF